MQGSCVRERPSGLRLPVAARMALVASLVAVPGHALSLRILSRPVIPDSIRGAYDLRYADDQSVLLTCAKNGTIELPLVGANRSPHVVVPGSGPHSLWGSRYLGLSAQFLAVGAPAFQIVWMARGAPERWGAMMIDSPASLDVWKDRLLLLGFRKGPDDKGLPDGSMAWIGSLSEGLKVFKPVLFSTSGPGKNPLGLWRPVEAGKVRFLAEGSFVIVPGVEPGVYLYAPDDHLVRIWDSRALGIDVCATDSKEQGLRVAANLVERAAFVNARRVVDEILPLAKGPALVVRRVNGGSVHWALKVLRPDGGVEEVGLPLEADSQFWHVSGDVRGNKIMILLREFAGRDGKAFAHPRLVELEVVP